MQDFLQQMQGLFMPESFLPSMAVAQEMKQSLDAYSMLVSHIALCTYHGLGGLLICERHRKD